jgi:hypothetical protein
MNRSARFPSRSRKLVGLASVALARGRKCIVSQYFASSRWVADQVAMMAEKAPSSKEISSNHVCASLKQRKVGTCVSVCSALSPLNGGFERPVHVSKAKLGA